jgi:hypothetical protein
LTNHLKDCQKLDWSNNVAPISWNHAFDNFIEVIEDEPTIEAESVNVNSYQTAYKNGEYDTLDLLAGAWHGKQYYFKQRNGMIYSRETCQYMTLDDAIAEFANRLGDDGSI